MIEKILSKLHKVKKYKRGTYAACCPAHNDKNPSLYVTEKSDGTLLIHCMSRQCSAVDIMAAIGLEMTDLFPEKLSDHRRKIYQPWNPGDILESLSRDMLVVSMHLEKFVNEKDLKAGEWMELKEINLRFNAARDLINV